MDCRNQGCTCQHCAWAQAMQSYYGGVGRTWMTLFRGLMGADWGPFAAPLAAINPVWGAAWALFIALGMLGLFNVLNGVVVDIVRRATWDGGTVWGRSGPCEAHPRKQVGRRGGIRIGRTRQTAQDGGGRRFELIVIEPIQAADVFHGPICEEHRDLHFAAVLQRTAILRAFGWTRD